MDDRGQQNVLIPEGTMIKKFDKGEPENGGNFPGSKWDDGVPKMGRPERKGVRLNAEETLHQDAAYKCN